MATQAATGPAPLSARNAWLLVAVATSTMAVSYVDRQAFAVLAPTITAELDISEVQYGWLSSAFSVAYLVGAPLAGGFIDRVGARRGLVGSVLVWSAVAAVHALVPGLWVLLVLRVLLGLAEAPSFPGAAQTVSRVLPPVSRSTGFGVLFTGSSIGAALTGVLAPTLAGWWGWRAALVATAVVGLAWVPAWLAVTSGARARAVLDVDGGPSLPTDGLDGTIPVAPAFRWIDLLRDRAVLRAVAAVLASAPINGFVINFGAKLLVTSHGVTQTDVRDYLWLPPLVFDAGAVGFGVLASARVRRLGGVGPPDRLLFGAAAVFLLAIGGLAWTRTPWETTLVASVALAGGGAVYALATADMLARVPAGRVAICGGMTAAAQSLALIVAFPLIGQAVQTWHGYREVALYLAAWSIPGVVAWLLIPVRAPATPGAGPRS